MTTRDAGHIAHTRGQPAPRNVIGVSARDDRRQRRYSEGIERKPPPPANLRVGRYSDGLERSPRGPATRHVGNFAEGIAHHPDASWEHRIGSFADGYECLGDGRRDRGS